MGGEGLPTFCNLLGKIQNVMLTVGCKAIIPNANARIMDMTMKKTFRPQSWPEGLNQMNRIPENANAIM
jgi:hypothetical protein